MKKRMFSIIFLLGVFAGQGTELIFATDEQRGNGEMLFDYIERIRDKYQDEEMEWLLCEREKAIDLISDCRYEIQKNIALLCSGLTEEERDRRVVERAKRLFKTNKMKKIITRRSRGRESRVTQKQEGSTNYTAARLIDLQEGLKYLNSKIRKRREYLERKRLQEKRDSFPKSKIFVSNDTVNEFFKKRESFKKKQQELQECQISQDQLKLLNSIATERIQHVSGGIGFRKFVQNNARRLKNTFNWFLKAIKSAA